MKTWEFSVFFHISRWALTRISSCCPSLEDSLADSHEIPKTGTPFVHHLSSNQADVQCLWWYPCFVLQRPKQSTIYILVKHQRSAFEIMAMNNDDCTIKQSAAAAAAATERVLCFCSDPGNALFAALLRRKLDQCRGFFKFSRSRMVEKSEK